MICVSLSENAPRLIVLEKNIRFHRWILMHQCALKQMLNIICISNTFHFTRGAPLVSSIRVQLTSWEQHSFDSNLGTIWSHRGAVPFHAIVLINNSPQDVIQTRMEQYSFLKNTAILTCFSCPAALLLFSEKQEPRRQVLWPLCSVQLSWLNPQGSLYLAIDLQSLKFGPVCVTIYLFIPGASSQLFSLCFSLWNLCFCCISGFSITSVAPFSSHILSLVKNNI